MKDYSTKSYGICLQKEKLLTSLGTNLRKMDLTAIYGTTVMDNEWKNRTTFKALRKISNYTCMSLLHFKLVAQYLALET